MSTSQATAAGTTASIVTLISTSNPSTYGQPVTFNVVVSGMPGMGNPTGSITLSEGGTPLGTATLIAGAGITSTASITSSSLSAGTHTITATYNGDTNYAASTSSPVMQVVNKASTVTTLMPSPSPSTYGQPVTFNAAVTGVSGLTPTGTVTFSDMFNGVIVWSNTVTLSPSGVVPYVTISSLSVGTHTITATYNGDTNYAGSTSSTVTQDVNKASTVTTLISSMSPSVYGQPVTFAATVTGDAGTPTGTVTFSDGSGWSDSPTLDGSGVATITTSSLSAGTHTITATYNGDANCNPSTSSPITQDVNKASTVTTLMPSPSTSVYGESVTFTATVSTVAPGAGTPTGIVTFLYGGIDPGYSPLNAAGQATYATSSLWAGTYMVAALYNGDANYTSSSLSVPITQTVDQSSTTVTLASSSNPSSYGQPVTFTATVTAFSPGSGTPMGAVTFYDGPTQLGTGTISGGIATFTTPSLSAGTHTITATYQGDPNYLTSTSSAVSQMVDQISTTVTLTSLVNPSVYGQSVTFTAAVIGGNGDIPAGTVTFYNGSTSLGTSTLNASGKAALATSSLSAGTNQITATYSGDVDYSASTSSTLQQIIVTPTPWPQPVTISMVDMYGHATLTPTPTPTVTPTVTPTPTLKPIPTPPSVPTSIPTINPATEQNGGFPWWLILVGIGIVAVIAIGYLFLKKQ